MIVNSINFLLFFIVVFIVYYFLFSGKAKFQNAWLLLASYFFYGFAEWKMIPLLLMSTIAFYAIGIVIGKYNETDEKKASVLTTVGTLLGVGVLLYFKYLNFFVESFSSFFNAIGLHTNLTTFNILMPLGISFFTFKLISYVIEVHRGHIEPCRDFISFATYIAFFPTILSGPIDRPKPFLTQLKAGRTFDYPLAVDGCRQILWGMFKKMVIADNIAIITTNVWGSYAELPGSLLMVSALLYTFQLYADFSGYSDMAIGVGKILGLRIAINFNYPFFALNIADYWRRWHISLTSWLTDYVFMPLNIKFRNYGTFGIIMAILINLILVGLWHGANMTFAVFGLYHGLLFIPLIISGAFMKKSKLRVNRYGFPALTDFSKMVGTYLLVSLGMIIFASENLSEAFDYMKQMVVSMGDIPSREYIYKIIVSGVATLVFVFSIVVVILIEWKNRNKEYGMCFMYTISNKYVRYLIYQSFILFILLFQGHSSPFIYFQF